MPFYDFEDVKTRKRFELFMPIAEMEKRVKADGTFITDAGRVARRVFTCNVPPPSTKVYYSRAMGCGKKHVKQRNQRLFHELGIRPVDAVYLPDGRLEMTGRKNRNKMLKLTGNIDGDGSYGDYVGK